MELAWKSMLAALAAAVLVAASAAAATVDTSAWYVLVNRNSGKAMDIFDFATTAARASPMDAQRPEPSAMAVRRLGRGLLPAESRHSGKVLDDPQRSTAEMPDRPWTDLNGDQPAVPAR